VQYDCSVAEDVKLPVETAPSDGRQLRWLLMLLMTCVGVVLMIVLACNSMKLAMTSRHQAAHVSDIISVQTVVVVCSTY